MEKSAEKKSGSKAPARRQCPICAKKVKGTGKWKLKYGAKEPIPKKSEEKLKLARKKFLEKKYSQAKRLFYMVKDEFIEAVFYLGIHYHDGVGVEKNVPKGMEYMMQVASLKSFSSDEEPFVREAQYVIGLAYFLGTEFFTSKEDAEKWWLCAANGTPSLPGTIKARSSLGMFYSREETKNPEKAMNWHKRASNYGNLESLGALGAMHLHGMFTKQDDISALRCLLEASTRGNYFAMGTLALFYYQHRMYQNTVEVCERISKISGSKFAKIARDSACGVHSVIRGVALACFLLGACLQEGKGIEENTKKAKEMIKKALEIDTTMAYEYHIREILGNLDMLDLLKFTNPYLTPPE